MKLKFFYLLLLVIIMSGCSTNVSKSPPQHQYHFLETYIGGMHGKKVQSLPSTKIESLKEKDGIFYAGHGDNEYPYNGDVYGGDDRVTRSGTIKNGKRHGLWKWIFDDIYIYTTTLYQDGLEINTRRYHTDGSLKGEENFLNGVPHGLEFIHYDNKRIKHKLYYKNGKLHGKQYRYHENGRLASSWTYEDGDCIDGPVISYHDNGNISIKGQCLYGGRHGEWKHYNKDGTISMKISYKKDEIDGLFISYFENGAVQFMNEYKGGKKSGESVFYREDGSIKSRARYLNDEVIQYKSYDFEGKLISK